jgi:DNA-binding CsgD family transcriptional regulator
MVKKIEDCINALNAANDPGEAFTVFAKAMKGYGYNQVAYGFLTDHPSLGLGRVHGHATSFPEEWMDYYTKNDMLDVDPVPNYMLRSALPAFWGGVTANAAGDPLQLMRDAVDVGLVDGAMVPLHAVGGEVAYVTVALDKVHPEQTYENLAAIQMLSTFFHEKYKSFLRNIDPVELTDREVQVLQWAAEGKTDEEISDILCISAHTVRYHWRKIFDKLQACGRTYAIVKAIRMQLISKIAVIKNY